ncbi:protein DMP2 [Typha latifolia]|uniref:protein DMP2 n=1 Tax=Typha latifolia TaxID=4733 RepID=UPI003C30853C
MAGDNTQTLTSSSSTTKSQSTADKAFKGVGNLIKVLPSGTVFIFQFLNPLLTSNGKCHTSNKFLTGALLILCGLSCFFSSFTDSYKGSDGKIYYGIATIKGLYSFSDLNSSSVNLSKYKLRLGDFVHAFFSLLVFGVIAMLDSKIVSCFYPSFESDEKAVNMALPVVVGAIASAVFVVFPYTRHGIGYPYSESKENSSE